MFKALNNEQRDILNSQTENIGNDETINVGFPARQRQFHPERAQHRDDQRRPEGIAADPAQMDTSSITLNVGPDGIDGPDQSWIALGVTISGTPASQLMVQPIGHHDSDADADVRDRAGDLCLAGHHSHRRIGAGTVGPLPLSESAQMSSRIRFASARNVFEAFPDLGRVVRAAGGRSAAARFRAQSHRFGVAATEADRLPRVSLAAAGGGVVGAPCVRGLLGASADDEALRAAEAWVRAPEEDDAPRRAGGLAPATRRRRRPGSPSPPAGRAAASRLRTSDPCRRRRRSAGARRKHGSHPRLRRRARSRGRPPGGLRRSRHSLRRRRRRQSAGASARAPKSGAP